MLLCAIEVPGGDYGGRERWDPCWRCSMELQTWLMNDAHRFKVEMSPINLDRIQEWINQGRLNPDEPITMKELKKTRCLHGVKRHGVKLLSRVREPHSYLSKDAPELSRSPINPSSLSYPIPPPHPPAPPVAPTNSTPRTPTNSPPKSTSSSPAPPPPPSPAWKPSAAP